MTKVLVLAKFIFKRTERFVHVILSHVLYYYYSVPVTAMLTEEVSFHDLECKAVCAFM